MKLLVYGHWSHTGFGVVTEALGTRLVAAGVDVRVLARNHRGEPVRGTMAGRVWPLDNLERYFANVHRLSIDGTLWQTLDINDEWKPDAILVIADVSGLRDYVRDDIQAWADIPVFHYCPIEGDDLPVLWKAIWSFVSPVTMSRYGQRVVSEFLGRDVPMIYHGVDTDTFYPVSAGKPIRFAGGTLRTKAECKAKFGIPEDAKVLFRADRNVARKNYEALIRSFVPISEAEPDALLILHCQIADRDGQDLRDALMKVPDELRPRIRFTQAHDTFRGLPPEGLNALYNAADIYVSTTGGEGFGLTLAEALAAGVPVVTNGYAAEVEVVGDGGVILPPLTDQYGNVVTFHNPIFGMAWSKPDERLFTQAVIDLLANPKRGRELGAAGRLHVKRSFSWDEAAASFLSLLTSPAAEVAA